MWNFLEYFLCVFEWFDLQPMNMQQNCDQIVIRMVCCACLHRNWHWPFVFWAWYFWLPSSLQYFAWFGANRDLVDGRMLPVRYGRIPASFHQGMELSHCVDTFLVIFPHFLKIAFTFSFNSVLVPIHALAVNYWCRMEVRCRMAVYISRKQAKTIY